jgi:hypothetical protein
MTIWRVFCPGFARFLCERSTRVQELTGRHWHALQPDGGFANKFRVTDGSCWRWFGLFHRRILPSRSNCWSAFSAFSAFRLWVHARFTYAVIASLKSCYDIDAAFDSRGTSIASLVANWQIFLIIFDLDDSSTSICIFKPPRISLSLWYHGASTAILAVFCITFIFAIRLFAAVPHNCVPEVQTGFINVSQAVSSSSNLGNVFL